MSRLWQALPGASDAPGQLPHGVGALAQPEERVHLGAGELPGLQQVAERVAKGALPPQVDEQPPQPPDVLGERLFRRGLFALALRDIPHRGVFTSERLRLQSKRAGPMRRMGPRETE